MVKKLAVTVVLVALIITINVNPANAQMQKNIDLFNSSHQAGVRLGVWSHQGGTNQDTLFSTDHNNSVVYFEAYFAYRLTRPILLELSAGMVNRGTVSISSLDFGSDVGNLMFYPILLQAKLYPLASQTRQIQPYFVVGGGVFFGRRTIQFTTNNFVPTSLREDSKSDFNYVVGGGADYILTDKLSLDFSVKYMPINLSEELVGVKDYSAVAFTIGIKYLYRPKKK